ncbi:MAG TPA: DMT family transporter [Candidatus Cloacimonadota bacterium]|nr:DMT family transporter [Candidatus Cloacimonadota bacterium]
MFSSYLYLVLTAAIWGFAFVAQRMGNAHLDPFLYNALRFALGALCIGIVALLSKQKQAVPRTGQRLRYSPLSLGLVLFIASSLQQTGMLWTTAGAAGFITGLYVVMVPLLGLFRGQKMQRLIWVSSVLAVAGLGLINDFSNLEASLGNALVLLGAIFWALHVQLVDKLRQSYDTLELAFTQYAVTAALSLVATLVWNGIKAPAYLISEALLLNIGKAAGPILYGGIFSVGIAFSLQAYAQKRVAPARAAIILCSEAVFALFGGWLLLGEAVLLPMLIGSALVGLAMLIAVRA